jgi:hypothetical protein
MISARKPYRRYALESHCTCNCSLVEMRSNGFALRPTAAVDANSAFVDHLGDQCLGVGLVVLCPVHWAVIKTHMFGRSGMQQNR